MPRRELLLSDFRLIKARFRSNTKCPEKAEEHPEGLRILDAMGDYYLTADECEKYFNPIYVERYFAHLLNKGLEVANVKKCPEPGCPFEFWVA